MRVTLPQPIRLVFAVLVVVVACVRPAEAQEKAAPVRKDALGDPLPPGAIMRIGTLRMRHQDGVYGVAISPNGKIVASTSTGSFDKSIRLWSAESGKEISRLETPRDFSCPNGVVFSPDGTIVGSWILFTSRSDIRLWDVRTGKVIDDWEDGGGTFAFSADGKTIVSVRSSTVRFRDVQTRKQTSEFEKPDLIISGVALSPDGSLVACVGGTREAVSAVKFRVGVYEAATGKELWKSAVPVTEGVSYLHPWQDLAFSPDGMTVAVAGYSKPVHLFDAKTGRRRSMPDVKAISIAYSPDGSMLALGTYAGRSIVLWDLANNKMLRQLDGHGGLVTRLAFSQDGKTLVSGSFDHSVRMWDVASGKEKHQGPGHEYRVLSVAYLPDGRLVSHGSDHTVRIWNAKTGKEERRLNLPSFDQPDRRRDYQCHDTNQYPRAMAVSPDGKAVAVSDPRQSLHLWDIASGKEQCLLKGHKTRWIAFTPDGKQLASADEAYLFDEKSTSVMRVWSSADGKLQATYRVPKLWSMAFDPKSGSLLTGGIVANNGRFSSEISRRKLSDGTEQSRWQPVPRFFGSDLVISPDGRTYAVGGVLSLEEGHPIILGELRDDAPLRMLHRRARPSRGPRQVNSVSFSSDGKMLVSAGEADHTVRVWEVSTGQELFCFKGHAGSVDSAAFSPDSRTVASGGADSTILVWDIFEGGRSRLDELRKALTPLWTDLASPDSKVGYRAVCALCLAGDRAVEMLADNLKPVPPNSRPKTTRQLIEDLNHRQFAVRATADAELRERGRSIASELQEAMKKPAGIDAQRLLERLVADLDNHQPVPESLRRLRAVQALELMRSGKATKLLQTLAAGAEWAELTREANESLERLRRR